MAHSNKADLFSVPSGETPLGWLSYSGEILNSRGIAGPMRVLGQRALVLMTAGEGFYMDSAGCSRRVRPGSMVHVFPTLPHRYGPDPGGRWDEIFLCYGGPIFDLCEAKGILNPANPVWDMPSAPEWERRFVKLLTGWKVRSAALPAIAQWVEFLTAAAVSSAQNSGTPDWLTNILEMLEHETRLPLSRPIEEMAASCGMGYESLRKKFRAAMGCGLMEYHRNRILDRATDMMRQTKMTLSEIAGLFGFCDEFHLAKSYKARFGITPGAARRLSER